MEHVPQDKLMQYVDKELSEKEAQEVREHLEQCDQCRDAHSLLANFSESVTQTGRFVFNRKALSKEEEDSYTQTLSHRIATDKGKMLAAILIMLGFLLAIIGCFGYPVMYTIAVIIAGLGIILYLWQVKPSK